MFQLALFTPLRPSQKKHIKNPDCLSALGKVISGGKLCQDTRNVCPPMTHPHYMCLVHGN